MSDKKETIYPKGITCFKKNDKAPDFIIGTQIITLDDLNEWAKNNPQYLTDYNGKKQIRLQMAYSKNEQRPTVTVDTWKPETARNEQIEPAEDLPF